MKSSVITVFFIAILLFISFHFLLILMPFSGSILLAAILAFAFYPLHQLVFRVIPRPLLAALFTTLLVLAAIVPVVVWAITNVSGEAVRGAQWLTAWVKNEEYIGLIDRLSALPIMDRLRSTGIVDRLKTELGAWASASLGAWGGFAATQAAAITKNALLLVANLLFTVFFFFIFLKDGKNIIEFVTRILPLDDDNKKEVMGQVRETFAAVIHGQVLCALIKSALVGVTFWALGLPLPIFFAAVTLFASFLPIFGAAAVWFPFVLYLASEQDWMRAGILLVVGAIPINLVDNVIQPLIIGQRSGLPYALLLVAVIGGVTQYGVFGIFIGPVVMALFFALVRIYRAQFLDKSA